ncbi:MAG: hypothetical protein ACJ8CR_07135 [Roseiflexaceae bacterium]
MPYQNRVSPRGEIVATPARGALMGNRGCLHDNHDHPVRQYQVRRWLICVLDFKGRTRTPMPPGHYTSLFFLDEATALAAGHRPCAECQRARFNDFRRHWAAANPELAGGPTPPVDTIDMALHRERISEHRYQRDKVKLTYIERLDVLPNGVFVVREANGTPYLVLGDALYPWSFDGYGDAIARQAGVTVAVLTPRSTVQAVAYGFTPTVHPSARPHSLAAGSCDAE